MLQCKQKSSDQPTPSHIPQMKLLATLVADYPGIYLHFSKYVDVLIYKLTVLCIIY